MTIEEIIKEALKAATLTWASSAARNRDYLTAGAMVVLYIALSK